MLDGTLFQIIGPAHEAGLWPKGFVFAEGTRRVGYVLRVRRSLAKCHGKLG